MRVLITGSSGTVGSAVCQRLVALGHEVVPFDLTDGGDVLDNEGLARAIEGCAGVVHAAALLDGADPSALETTNVDGTKNVLEAAEASGVPRLVHLSSLAVLGVFKGHRAPDYLPLDEEHPAKPVSAYEETKAAAEGLVLGAAQEGRLDAVVLRCPGVWTPETYSAIARSRLLDPTFEFEPYWEYGAFVDVRDLAGACVSALTVAVRGGHIVHVASSDLSTSGPTAAEWARRLHPDVEWRGAPDRHPFAGLVSLDRARELLGWEPEFTWRRHLGAVEASGE